VKGLNAPAARQEWTRTEPPRARLARASAAPRVLLLTSGLGSGHVRAAEALAAALHRLEPGVNLRQLDFWSLMNPGVAASIKRRYLSLVLDHPDLYSRLHRLDEGSWRRVIENDIPPPAEVVELIERFAVSGGNGSRSFASLLDWALGPYPSDLLFFPTACAALPTNSQERAAASVALLRQALLKWAFLRLQGRMEQRLQDFAPDVVIATQMVPAALVSALKQSSRRWRRLPLIGVLTDFGAHDYWSQPGIDLYCLPHEDVLTASQRARSLARFGAQRVATGVPLMPAFEQPPSQAVARARIGLDPHSRRPVVLVLGGGLGLGLEDLVGPMQSQLPECSLLVMAGRNVEVRNRLPATDAAAGAAQVHVRGWTEHMENYIAAADVVVGKPGGLTVAEVLACGRPLLVTRSLQGQESFNVQFVERRQVGAFVNEADLPATLAAWLEQPERLAALQQQAFATGRRDGARRVARHALALAARVPRGFDAMSEAG
jgi:UDP-N-acetylglucosamine:LPS N-acetylglucosamine transferase